MESSKSHHEQESKLLSKSSAETIHLSGCGIKEIYAFGRGLNSLRDVVGLPLFISLEFLSLHDNNIDRIEGLETLLSLRELNLSSNKIKEMEGLSTLSQLEVLNLSCNQVEEIKDLQGLWAMNKLVLSHNHIKSLCGLSALRGPRYSLRTLDLRDNRVDCLSEFRALAGCIHLKELSFARGNQTNPVCQAPAYKSSVIAATPHLYKLDDELLSGTLPVEFIKTLPQFGATYQSYLDASIPSSILQYTSLDKSDPRDQDGESRDLPFYNNSDESQPEKVLLPSPPQLSVLLKLQNVEFTRQDNLGRGPCRPNPDPTDISEGQYNTKEQYNKYSSSRETVPLNLSSGSKNTGIYQTPEASDSQQAYEQSLDRADQRNSSPRDPVPSPSQDGSRRNREESEQELFRTDEKLEVNDVSTSTGPGLSVTNHSLNGFYRRRWPNTLSSGSKKINISDEACDDGAFEELERRILDLVHELAVAKRGAKRGLQALQGKSTGMIDEVAKSTLNDAFQCAKARCTRKGKERCFRCGEEKKYSSGSDTSDNQELKIRKKCRRHVWWSDENIMRQDSDSKPEGDGSELQNVLQLLNEEVKHLHQAVLSLSCVTKVQETQTGTEKDIMCPSKDDENDTGDSKNLAKCKALEDQLAETIHRFDDENKDLCKKLDAKRQAVLELEKILKEKNEKLQELLKHAKQTFPCQSEDSSVCPEDHIHETIISAKAELFSMEKSLQRATLGAQSAKAALLNATTDKDNSKQLVISMYKALEEERANLKLCKSELEMCQLRCLEISKEQEKSKLELEKVFEEKQKELALVKMLHKQEVESVRALGVELGKSQGTAMAEENSAQLRRTMREELSDKQKEINEARREDVKVRQDMASLRIEHHKDVAELKEVIHSLLSKEQNKDALILELSKVVRSQKAQLQAVNLNAETLAVTERELQRKEQEIGSLKVRASRCDELVQKVDTLQQKLTAVANDKADNEKNLVSKLISLQQENSELAASFQRLESSEDAVKIKNKMLESQNESIKDLKEELSEATKAFTRVLKTSETLETEWIKRLQNEAEKAEDLRSELKSCTFAMDALEEKLKVERAAKQAAEKTAKLLQRKVEEEEEMLRYVEDEISQVKNLYDNKLRATAVERDQAMEELKKTQKEMEQTKEEFLEEAKKRRELSAEVQKSRDLMEARNSLQKQIGVLKETMLEKDFQLKEAGRRMLELESQLNYQTLAMEKQKAVACSKYTEMPALVVRSVSERGLLPKRTQVEKLRRALEDLGDLK